MAQKDDLKPKAFKPLNDFVLKDVADSVSDIYDFCSNFVFYVIEGGEPPECFLHYLLQVEHHDDAYAFQRTDTA